MINNTRGYILMVALIVVLVLAILGGVLVFVSVQEKNLVERHRMISSAFHIAEAGIERMIYELRQDYIDNQNWVGNINGWAYDFNPTGFSPFPNPDPAINPTYNTNWLPTTQLNSGSYSIELMNVPSASGDVWVRSTGNFKGQTQTIQIYAKMFNFSIWNNVIFAGAGQSGMVINGNVDIRGSVHVLGEGLEPDDIAIHLSGDAMIGNNYYLLDPALEALVPDLPTILYGGETVETLFASLRVKQGQVYLDGSSQIGQSNQTLNGIKETMDGSYVTDGFGGNQAPDFRIYSDNGWSNPYDLGNAMGFPSLSGPAPNPDFPGQTIQQYFANPIRTLVINNDLDITPTSSFIYPNGLLNCDGVTNCIQMNNGTLTVKGQVYVEGELGFNRTSGVIETIEYQGSGTILAEEDVTINANLITQGPNSFPTNIIGIMTPLDMSIGPTLSQLNIMGLFYAEVKASISKQTDIMGTIVSNYFDMGNQVPSIFQVPDTVDHLPPGLIGGEPFWFMQIVSWQKL